MTSSVSTRSRLLGVSSALFDGHAIETWLPAAAEAGIDYVEPAFIPGYSAFEDSAFSEAEGTKLRKTVLAAGLSVRAVSAHVDLGKPEASAALSLRIRYAEALGAALVVTNAADLQDRDQCLRTLESILPICEETGISLGVENPGYGPTQIVASGRLGAALVAPFKSRFLGLTYDTANVLTLSEGQLRPEVDLVDTARILHCHLKDAELIDCTWQYRSIGGGAIDYPAVIGQLDRVAPGIPFTLELPIGLVRPQNRPPFRRSNPIPFAALVECLRQSARFVSALL